MSVIFDRTHKAIHEGRNVQVLRNYTSKHEVSNVSLYATADGYGLLSILWANGSYAIEKFASYEVLCKWADKRKAFKGKVWRYDTEMLRISNASNGIPRYVVHFFRLLNEAERDASSTPIQGYTPIDRYALALDRARLYSGRAYRSKSYGGGVVFTTSDPTNLLWRLLMLVRGELT